MSDATFTPEWLALREPVDHRSRPQALIDLLLGAAKERSWSRALDLGAGTGSNLRYLAPRLPFIRDWTLLDQDVDLLGRIGDGPHAAVRTVTGDLSQEGLAAIGSADLVTASALLDLVSEPWVRSLVDECVRNACAGLFALSYDGAVDLDPPGPGDAFVLDAVNAHQERDKGLGSALGPRAAALAATLFEAAGFRTWLVPSPWVLAGEADAALAGALVRGWVEAAAEQRPDRTDELRSWEGDRLATISSAHWEIRVGHFDLLALPPA